MLDHLIRITDRVEYLLEKYPPLRDSDKLLWLAYLCHFHGLGRIMPHGIYQRFKDMLMHEDTPPMESVRRVRQKIQESGSYRGELWADRQAEGDLVRENIHTIPD